MYHHVVLLIAKQTGLSEKRVRTYLMDIIKDQKLNWSAQREKDRLPDRDKYPGSGRGG